MRAPQNRRGGRARRWCGLLAVLLLLVASGCGGGGTAPPRGLPGAAEQILSKGDVDHYRDGTPEHALLTWWRDAQYTNFAGYMNAFQQSVKEKLQRDPGTPIALNYFSSTIRVARPEIVSTHTRGDTATVYTRIEYRTPIGTTRYVTASRPQAFVLLRRNGRWLLQNDSFVQTSLPEDLRRAPS